MSKRVSSSATSTAGGTATNPAGSSSSSSSNPGSTMTSARMPPRPSTTTAPSIISLDLNRPSQSGASAPPAAARSSSLNSNEVPPSTRHLATSGNEQGSAQSLIDLKTEANFFHRIKKRPISGVLTSDADSELTW